MAEPESGGGASPTSANRTATFDPSKIAEQFRELAKEHKLPSVGIDALIANRDKNIEALRA